jgi:soluble lytic murein transglycosylase-like protein
VSSDLAGPPTMPSGSPPAATAAGAAQAIGAVLDAAAAAGSGAVRDPVGVPQAAFAPVQRAPDSPSLWGGGQQAAAGFPGPTLPVSPLPAAPAPFAPPAAPQILPVAFQPVQSDPALIPHFALISAAAAFYSLPVELVLAVVKVESNFNPRAVSRKGAQGLMQLMPATAASLGVVDAFDPRQNVQGGAMLLRSLVNDFEGQVALALAGYNAGAGAVRRHGGIPPIPETQSYVPTVLAVYRAYLAAGLGRREAIADGSSSLGTARAPW